MVGRSRAGNARKEYFRDNTAHTACYRSFLSFTDPLLLSVEASIFVCTSFTVKGTGAADTVEW